ncbi:C-C chemokine receptor type 2 [Tribolium castaneum]|uniref:C-C chemokine receptor type 2 n=1 Tax=Tribolium castaneum TaxID=7070 RepID=UPI0030FEC834
MDMPNITTGNFSDDVYQRNITSYERILLELFTIIALMSLTANSFLIFVIVKYEKLREDTTNQIFLHLNILQAVLLFSTPLTVRIANEFFWSTAVHLRVFCVLYQVETNVMFAIVGILFLIVCDSFLKIYYEDKYAKFRRICKFFLGGIYGSTACSSLLTVQYCIFNHYMAFFTYIVMALAVFIFVLFLIVINVIHSFKKRKLNYKSSNLGLVVPNIFFLLWCPFLIVLFVTLFYKSAHITTKALFLLGFLSPIFNLVYVYFWDDNYNVFLRQVFMFKCGKYQNDNLEDQSVAYDANGVHITQN